MVEKIIVNPESIRAYGNIIMPKTGADFMGVDCTVLVDTDTVNDEVVTVYSLESEATILNVVLSVDDGSVMIGDTVTLSATVTDEMTSPVVGASVSFRLNGSVIGSSDTNSSGVATLSYQCNSAGSLSFTGVCNNFTSNSVSVTVTGHSYSLSFDAPDYTVVGGSVVMMVSLSDYGTSVSGASVSLSGGGSSWSATTDSSGIATFNLTGVTVGGTYTASYGGASTTCNVVIQTYLFYDECNSSDGLSQYGSSVYVKNTSSSLTLSYDSTMNAYKVVGNNIDGYALIPIPALAGKDDFYIEAEFYSTYNNTKHQTGISVYGSAGNAVWARDIANINRCGWLKTVNGSDSAEAGNAQKSTLPVYNNWYKLRFEIDGTTATAKWMKTDDTLIYSYSYTIPTYSTQGIGLQFLAWSNPYYVRNIKAEYL